MNSQDFQERLDPILAAAYKELRDEPSPDVDWEGLRRAIEDRAHPLLARRRARGLVRLSRPLVPLALAASVAFALWIGPAVVEQMRGGEQVTVAPVASDVDEIFVRALDGDLSDHDFRLLVTGRSNPEVLLAFAISD